MLFHVIELRCYQFCKCREGSTVYREYDGTNSFFFFFFTVVTMWCCKKQGSNNNNMKIKLLLKTSGLWERCTVWPHLLFSFRFIIFHWPFISRRAVMGKLWTAGTVCLSVLLLLCPSNHQRGIVSEYDVILLIHLWLFKFLLTLPYV